MPVRTKRGSCKEMEQLRKEQEEAGNDHRRYSLHRCKRP